MIVMKIIIYILLVINFLNADILKENYITIDPNNDPGILLDFESDNLDQYIVLDTNDNGLISWKELRAKKNEIIEFVLPHLKVLSADKLCSKEVTNFNIHRRAHQSYIILQMKLSCELEDKIDIYYDLFFDVDRAQKVFVQIKDKNSSQPMVISSRKRQITLNLEKNSLFKTFVNFLVEGIWHIWIGFDHILFLLMLLIPSVIYFKKREIIPQDSLKNVIIAILKIVTAFTLAHSITLAMSVLDIVEVNMRYIEVAIALSVLFTALNNLFLFTQTKTWIIAFLFGLIHGFGFANVLKEMTLNSSELVGSLLGFNLGVEIGQLAIVLVVIPIIFLSRKTLFYKYVILYGFSTTTAVIAFLWAYERYFNLSILPF
jgi:hypothetical protein